SNWPLMSALNATDWPSGDHAGSRSLTQPSGLATRFGSRPSGVMVQIASNHVTASRLPSGDHEASRTPTGPAAVSGGVAWKAAVRTGRAPRTNAAAAAGVRTYERVRRMGAPPPVTLFGDGVTDGFDDRAGRNTVVIEELGWRSAPRDFPDREAMETESL